MRIPFFDMKSENQVISAEIESVVLETLKSGHYILGERLVNFENEFAAFCQTRFCLGVGNGLDALTLALRASGIGPGDKVAVPAHTFVATALAVIAAGAEPRLVDVDPETYTLDPKELARLEDPRIKAVIPVHLYGNPCQMDSIHELAKHNSWIIIEDNAQAQGAVYKGKRTGALGHLAATSFYPTKNLGAFGDAGAVTTNSSEYAQALDRLRNYGQAEKYNHLVEGVNSRLDEIQAAILSVKLRFLEASNQKRIRIAQRYLKQLKGVGDLQLPTSSDESVHVYHLFVVSTQRRDDCQSFLRERGIATLIHYPKSTHQHPAFEGRIWNPKQDRFPHSENVCRSVLSLPIYPTMTDAQVDTVCEALWDFFKISGTSR